MPDRRSRRSTPASRSVRTATDRGASGPFQTLRSPIIWRRGALLAAGAVLGLGLLGLVWPEQDPGLEAQAPATPASLGDVPRRPVTVLLIGSDSDQLKAKTNQAAPSGPANSDALVLVRKLLGKFQPFFELKEYQVNIHEPSASGINSSAMIKLVVGGQEEISAAEGDGPVNALDTAMRKALGLTPAGESGP